MSRFYYGKYYHIYGKKKKLLASETSNINKLAKNIPGLLVFLDFEKAFDTIEWPFIHKTFDHFNFGSSTLRWIKLFYHDIESCILNNGWSSNLFKLERGVRQGCPLSPYLFILGAEVLADAIRKHNNIKGILVDG